MEITSNLTQLQSDLVSARTVAIFLPQNLSLDKVAAALAWFLALKKAGKQVAVYCPEPMTVQYSNLVGVDRIGQNLAGRTLTISFDYVEGSIEKVSYNEDNHKFNLVILSKEGQPPLSTDRINYSYSADKADLVFLLDVAEAKDLGSLYQENRQLLEKSKTVYLGLSPQTSLLAQVNLNYPRAAAFSEVVANLLAQLRLPVDPDIATNLFLGLEKATQKFSAAKVGAATFEAAAFCLRAGAQRPGASSLPLAKAKPAPRAMLEEIGGETSTDAVADDQPPEPDWLEPKIYKGNTLI